jgi:hypothetical protein
MSYNATVDINTIDLFNNLKYDQNPVYEYKLRNIKYLPYDPNNRIDNKLIDDFNAMIVRKDTNYYGMSRSKKNYPMNHSDVLQSYQNELADYIKLYNEWILKLDSIKETEYDKYLFDYRYYVVNFTIPEIIRLNNIIALQISIPNDIPQKNKFYDQYLYIYFMGLIFVFVVIIIIIKTNHYL